MSENFIFKAIFISLAVHTAFLCAAYINRINDHRYISLRQNQVEISYRPAHKKVVHIREYPIKLAQHLDLSNNQKYFTDGTIPVALVKEKSILPFGMLDEHQPQNMRTMELSRRISIKPISSEKINNPVYAAYNEMVRDRIKERVYENYDKMDAGSVYLTFLLDANGVLKASQIIPEKTTASAHLQELSLRSLRQASPFPPFLKGMNLSEYPFNIEIQYEVSE